MSNKKELKVYCKRINEETKKEETLWVVAKNVLVNGKTLDEYLSEIKQEVVEANAKASENIERMNNLENVFTETIRGFITK